MEGLRSMMVAESIPVRGFRGLAGGTSPVCRRESRNRGIPDTHYHTCKSGIGVHQSGKEGAAMENRREIVPEKMEVNEKAYTVIKLLGKGKGGYSWLVRNEAGEKFVLKQIHHEPCSYYQFGDKLRSELQDYEKLRSIGIRMPELLDVDTERERILKAFIDGPTVAEMADSTGVNEAYLEQMRDMCQLLYGANTNIDYYPTNFVVQQGLLYYIDYECNEYMEQWDFEHWGIHYWLHGTKGED